MRRALALVLFAAAPLLYGQVGAVDVPYQKFVLKNGLTLLVHEDHKAPIVAVNIWYHVGSKNERIGKTGFAHLFEHLMFGGSENHPSRYIEALEPIGATDLNGTTSSDRTNYFQNVPTSALDYTLWLESDRMGHLLGAIDQKTLDLQRGVVQNEKRQGENQPYGKTYELIVKSTYPSGHPYSWTVIGSMEDLTAASMSDVQEWFKTYYGPTNAVLSIAGDIDANTARQKVEKYFGDIPAGPPLAAHRVWIAKMTGTHRQATEDRVPQSRIYKVWNVPQTGSPDADYLDLLARVMSQGKSSRLYKRLVYDDRIATDVSAFNAAMEIGGQFRIVGSAVPGGDLAKVEKAMDEEVARLLEEGPTTLELERVKTQRLSQILRGLERIGGFGGKSDVLATNQTYFGNPDAYKDSIKRIEAATPEDLRAAGKRWLSDGVYILEVRPFPKYEVTSSVLDRSKPPDLGEWPQLRLPKLQRATLSNGMKLVLAERHETPIVNCWMAFDAGYGADRFGLPGTAQATAALLTGGTKTRTAMEIADQQGLLGAQIGASSSPDTTVVVVSALKAKLDPTLALYADIILNPVFPQEDFARQQQLQLAAIKREKVTGVSMGLRVLPALLYGKDHPYGTPLTGSGTEESVSKLSREDLVKFHQTWFHPNNATLIVAGDTTLAEITPKLEKLFDGWREAAVPAKDLRHVAYPSKPVVYIMDRPGALQSDILVGQVAPPFNHPDQITLETLNSILGSDFGARINMNLRENKHWSYGARSVLLNTRGQQPYLAYAPVQSDKTKDAMAELNKEFQGIIGDRPPTPAELTRAQNMMTLRLPGSRETVDSVANSILDIVQFGLPDDYYEAYARKVRALNLDAVSGVAKSTLRPGSLVWVVIGDRKTIEAPVRELALGEVKFLDADGNPI
ncbi:MAG: insulinase family protein [Acidobacteria bacterium]|nr:insulinase family protein [Acidobacteriota bacterium]